MEYRYELAIFLARFDPWNLLARFDPRVLSARFDPWNLSARFDPRDPRDPLQLQLQNSAPIYNHYKSF